MGKRLLKLAVLFVVLAVVVITAALIYVDLSGIPHYPPGKIELKLDVTPERAARGRRTVQLLCVACHLDIATGSLAGKPMPDLPPQFGVAHSANITRDLETGIGAWTDGEIAYLLRTGVTRDGRYTPPWMVKLPKIADEDLEDLIAFLRSDDPLVRPVKAKRPPSKPSLLTKVLSRIAFKPLPYPAAAIAAPNPSDRVAYGRYLVQSRAICYPCHSADFAKIDDFVPEQSAGYLGGGNAMPDMNGRIVKTANITPDPETGIGKWSEDDFVRLIRFGVRPDRSVIVYPMVPFPELSDDEARAIFAYLRRPPPGGHRSFGGRRRTSGLLPLRLQRLPRRRGRRSFRPPQGGRGFPDERRADRLHPPSRAEEARCEDAHLGRRDRRGGLRPARRPRAAAG